MRFFFKFKQSKIMRIEFYLLVIKQLGERIRYFKSLSRRIDFIFIKNEY